jgi:RES domain-containing protein
VPESELEARIRSVGFRGLSATAFRHVAAGADPRSGLGAKIHGGRWNPPDSWPTVYLGFSRATVRGEWKRAASRQGLTLEDFLPRDLYEFDLELAAVLDLRDPAARKSVDVSDQALRVTGQAFCRRIGTAAYRLGAEGVAAPSATGEGDVVAVFLDRLHPASRLEPRLVEIWTGAD